MFLLVSVRHVGAHPGGYHHGVSIQIPINFGKTFPRISRMRNIPLTQILARIFVYLPPFISQILALNYWTVLILILFYFEWRDTENQQNRLQSRWASVAICTMQYTLLYIFTNKRRYLQKDFIYSELTLSIYVLNPNTNNYKKKINK